MYPKSILSFISTPPNNQKMGKSTFWTQKRSAFAGKWWFCKRLNWKATEQTSWFPRKQQHSPIYVWKFEIENAIAASEPRRRAVHFSDFILSEWNFENCKFKKIIFASCNLIVSEIRVFPRQFRPDSKWQTQKFTENMEITGSLMTITFFLEWPWYSVWNLHRGRKSGLRIVSRSFRASWQAGSTGMCPR